MKQNKLRHHLDKGLPLLSTRMWSTDPFFYEALGATGVFDYVEFVAEYATYDLSDLPNIVRACELNDLASLIKIDYQGRGFIGQKAVQAGFQGVMFVDHVNAEQVRESISLVKPKTAGSTGLFGYPNGRFIGGQSHLPVLDHVKRINDIVTCFMIEKEEAVNNIEEICSVPGVDMIQFGPADYCMSKGWERTEHVDDFKAAERKCIEVAIAHGVRPRCEIVNPADAEYYIKLGVKDFSLGDQLAKLKSFWTGQGKELSEMISGLK